MRFSTTLSVLACGAMTLAAAITPDVLVSRSAAISDVIKTLDVTVTGVLPKFDACMDVECTKELVAKVDDAVCTATSDIADLTGVANAVLAKQIADVNVKIVVKLDEHMTTCGDKCGDVTVYSGVDASISLLFKQLEVCVPGILALVSKLVVVVVTILKTLCFDAVIKALGLN